MAIRVAVSDDHPAVLAGIEYILLGADDFRVIGLAASSTELVELLSRQACDVVVTDYSMPGGRYGDGISLFGFLMRRFPKVRLVALTGLENPSVLEGILAAGVTVIVAKADDPEYLHEAVRVAHAGGAYASPSIRRLLDNEAPSPQGVAGAVLSRRETEVVRLFAEGLTVSDIGERVGRSRKTISVQKMAAMKKLGLKSDIDLFRYALANGLIRASGGPGRGASDDAMPAPEDVSDS